MSVQACLCSFADTILKSFLISTVRAGIRGHSFRTVFVLGLMLVFIGYLSALFSPRQPATVAMDVGLSGIHFALILLALFWTQELVGKEIDQRKTILLLAYPAPRAHYLLGRFAGISVLLASVSLLFGVLLWIAIFAAGHLYAQPHTCNLGWPFWATIGGVYLDCVIVAAFALCVGTISTSSAMPLAMGAAFAVASHTMGAVIDYLTRGAYGRADLVAHYGPVVDIAKWLIPDLSRLDWRIWPMYDTPLQPGLIPLSLLMGGCYVAAMLILAVHLFNRREFD